MTTSRNRSSRGQNCITVRSKRCSLSRTASNGRYPGTASRKRRTSVRPRSSCSRGPGPDEERCEELPKDTRSPQPSRSPESRRTGAVPRGSQQLQNDQSDGKAQEACPASPAPCGLPPVWALSPFQPAKHQQKRRPIFAEKKGLVENLFLKTFVRMKNGAREGKSISKLFELSSCYPSCPPSHEAAALLS